MSETIGIIKEIAIGAAKVGVNAIPYVGPALAEAIFETPSRLAQQRKEKHFEAVIQKLQSVSENSIDLDFIQSEDFCDLLQIILEKITAMITCTEQTFGHLSAATPPPIGN